MYLDSVSGNNNGDARGHRALNRAKHISSSIGFLGAGRMNFEFSKELMLMYCSVEDY